MQYDVKNPGNDGVLQKDTNNRNISKVVKESILKKYASLEHITRLSQRQKGATRVTSI